MSSNLREQTTKPRSFLQKLLYKLLYTCTCRENHTMEDAIISVTEHDSAFSSVTEDVPTPPDDEHRAWLRRELQEQLEASERKCAELDLVILSTRELLESLEGKIEIDYDIDEDQLDVSKQIGTNEDDQNRIFVEQEEGTGQGQGINRNASQNDAADEPNAPSNNPPPTPPVLSPAMPEPWHVTRLLVDIKDKPSNPTTCMFRINFDPLDFMDLIETGRVICDHRTRQVVLAKVDRPLIGYICRICRTSYSQCRKSVLAHYEERAWLPAGEFRALKRVEKSRNTKWRYEKACMVNEAQTLVRLRHKHILSDVVVVESSRSVVMSMPYFARGSLRDLIASKEAYSHGKIFCQLSSALHYMHAIKRITHGDIKPGNVLIDSQGNALFTDFGFARVMTGQPLSRHIFVKNGTHPFMAPEIDFNSRVCPFKVDTFAMGVLAYNMVKSKVPKVSKNFNHLNAARTLIPEDHKWRPMLEHLLVVNPAHRWETVELVSHLRVLYPDIYPEIEVRRNVICKSI